MGKNIFFFTSSQMKNFTEIFRFEKFFIYLKEERQKDKIIMADRRRELVFLKNDQFLLWIHLRCSLHVTQLILTTRYVPGRLRISMQIHWAGVFGSKILVASPPAPLPRLSLQETLQTLSAFLQLFFSPSQN